MRGILRVQSAMYKYGLYIYTHVLKIDSQIKDISSCFTIHRLCMYRIYRLFYIYYINAFYENFWYKSCKSNIKLI